MDADKMTHILGEDPSREKTYGAEVYGSLASRWTSYLRQGIEKDIKSNLFDRLLIPSNCLLLEAPILNPEVQAMIASDAKKDAFIMDLQNQLGKGISALGTVLFKTLETTETNYDDLDPNLASLKRERVEAGKMLCSIHHAMTNHRKFQLYPKFKSKILNIAAAQSRDNFLERTSVKKASRRKIWNCQLGKCGPQLPQKTPRAMPPEVDGNKQRKGGKPITIPTRPQAPRQTDATARGQSTETASTSTRGRREPDIARENLTPCGEALPWGPQCYQGSLPKETYSRKCHGINDCGLKP